MIMVYRTGTSQCIDGINCDYVVIPMDGLEEAKAQGWKTHAEFFFGETEAKRRGRPPKVKEEEHANETEPSQQGIL